MWPASSGNPCCSGRRETATSRCYYQVLTDRGLDHWGRYIDRYRRVDGRWRFAERKVTTDGVIPGGWGDQSAT